MVKTKAAIQEIMATPMLSGANHEHARDHNQRVTLQAIRLHGPTGRAELAEITGLTLPSIANITKRLIAAGLVTEVSRRSGAPGQPARRVGINPDGCAALGINIDRDHVSLALIDFAGRIRACFHENINYVAPEDLVSLVGHELPRLLKEAGIAPAKLIGAGVAMPDQFGHLELPPDRSARFKAWREADIRALLREKTGLPIYLENDAAAAAIGEYQFGDGPRAASFFYTFIGIGLGGGLVLDGRSWRGATGRSGELGFMPVTSANPRERFLADIVSLNVLYRRLARAGCRVGAPADLSKLNAAHQTVLDAWLDEAAAHLARAFAHIACLVNPGTLFIGGRLPRPLLQALGTRVDRFLPRLMPHLAPLPTISLASRTDDAAVLGAAVLPIAAQLLPVDATSLRTG